MWHMEVPMLGVKVELQLPVYTTAAATPDPSWLCDLHHSSRQHQILNPLSEARDWTHSLMDTSQIRFHWATTGTPRIDYFKMQYFKLKIELPYDLAIPFLGIYPKKNKNKNKNTNSKRYMYPNIHSIAIHTITKIWKQPKCPKRQMGKEDVVDIHNGILLSH